MPVTFTILAAGFYDLTPIHELTYALPDQAVLYEDKAFNVVMDEASIFEEVGVLVIPIRRKNMTSMSPSVADFGSQFTRTAAPNPCPHPQAVDARGHVPKQAIALCGEIRG
jgi:hypothetical protein